MGAILKHEVRYYFKNIHELIYIYGFFLLFILIAPMGMRAELHLLPQVTPVLLFLSLAASVSLGATQLFQRDSDSGLLETYQQLPISLHAILLAKWLGFYLAIILPLTFLMPLYVLLAGLPLSHSPAYALAILAGGGGLSIICSLASALAAGLERARAVILLIVLPLSIPIMVFGSYYLRQPAILWQPSLMFLIALSIFLLPLMCLAGAASLRASN